MLCPLTSLPAIVLGTLALWRLPRTEAAAKSRRFALAAVLIGAIGITLQYGLSAWLADMQEQGHRESMRDTVLAAVEAAQQQDLDAIRDLWFNTEVNLPDDQAALDFGIVALDRYGPITGVSITNVSSTRSLLPANVRFEAALMFDFEWKERVLGHARYRVAGVSNAVVWKIAPSAIHIEDSEAGDLHLGAPAGAENENEDVAGSSGGGDDAG